MKCRNCESNVNNQILNLGFSPPSNSYLLNDDLNSPEVYFPLRVGVCSNCLLVQTEDYNTAEDLFTKDYAYFSSTSTYWLEHSKKYVEMIVPKLKLDSNSLVVEIASNDGYLLQNFKKFNIPCLGIEPTQSTANESIRKGINTIVDFFGKKLANSIAKEFKKADLVLGNNVLAHVPDIRDFVDGVSIILAENGTVNFEFPHLLNLINKNQFDTVYHEHFSYLSMLAVQDVFGRSGLSVYDVEVLDTHGGSLRVYGCHKDRFPPTDRLNALIKSEIDFGLNNLGAYSRIQENAEKTKLNFIKFLVDAAKENKSVAAFGAAAKGNTLLNFCGVKPDLLKFVCDSAISKQGKFLPGSHIPIYSEDAIKEYKPDYIVVFPWNILPEIQNQISYIRSWGGKFVVAVPNLNILD